MKTESILDTQWATLQVVAPPIFEDLLIYHLTELASNGIEVRDNHTYLKSDQQDTIIVLAYFPQEVVKQKAEHLKSRLATDPKMAELDWTNRIQHTPIVSMDWATAWQAHFHAIELSQRIVVCPSWETASPQPGQLIIEMDPGMAFGTGEHATTQLSVQAIEKWLSPGDAMVDLGTGTALLSIVAKKLGAGLVQAMDNDIDAIRSARENLQKNQVADVDLIHADLDTFQSDSEFDLIVGNLQTHIIKAGWPAIDQLFSSRTKVGIFTGILIMHKADLISFLSEWGYTVIDTATKNEWLLIVVQKNA